ncbi:MAG TPA: methanogenesis marker 2 protein, partial [Methanoregulaceae archaeon]|nr:methanogenesis marker 2 protein [Methanoregulaceae archaeon]
WDSVTMKSAAAVRAQVACLQELAEAGLVTAGKDISNPGLIGSLGMLLEVSGCGAVIAVGRIPAPDLEANGITFDHWLRMYPGMGFVLTVRPEDAEEVCRRFEAVGMAAAEIGEVDGSRRLSIAGPDGEATVFDFAGDGITRLAPCRGGGP